MLASLRVLEAIIVVSIHEVVHPVYTFPSRPTAYRTGIWLVQPCHPQQLPRAPHRVPDVEQPGEHDLHPTQGPPLVIDEPHASSSCFISVSYFHKNLLTQIKGQCLPLYH